MFEFTTATNYSPVRITKVPMSKALDVQSSKSAPLYLQIDGPEENYLKISLNVLHPRILQNSGVHIIDEVEDAYVVVEKFNWFEDQRVPIADAFVKTTGYDSVEIKFKPGRHICR